MNENTERTEPFEESDLEGSDPHPEEVEAAPAEEVSEDPDNDPREEPSQAAPSVETERDLSFLSAHKEDPDLPSVDPVLQGASLPDPRIDELRREISELKSSLAYHHMDRAEREVRSGEFALLYPDVSFEDLPDEVLTEVRRGIPVAAAYALAERRRVCKEAHAAEINRQNRSRSAGSLGIGETDLFSPAEVRAMTQAEVRANYDKIIQSMQSWH